MRVDMHLHTSASFDCTSDPFDVLRAALARGIDRICVTDHNTIEAAAMLKDRYPDRIIVGEEVKTREHVDIIGLYLEDVIPAGTPARETCTRIREQGGLVYVPHPFARDKGGGGRILPEIADLIDAVEAFNARLHDPALNERAERYARDARLPRGAGSDAHTVAEVGRAYIDVAPFRDDPTAFLQVLRGGTVHGRRSSRAVHLASTWAKVRKRFGGRP